MADARSLHQREKMFRSRRSEVGLISRELILIVCVFFAFRHGMVHAQDKEHWKTGNSFQQALAASKGFIRTDHLLRERLDSIGRESSLAIFLDRRVDSSLHSDFAARDLSLHEALLQLAASLDLHVDLLGNSVVCFVPKSAAGRLPALAVLRRREASQLASKSRWLGVEPCQWEELSEPRTLALSIAQNAGADIGNPEAIPHDVWPAWSGPALAPLDQLTLVLSGFDLTFAFQDGGSRVEIVPAPGELVYEQSYAVSGLSGGVINELKRMLPALKRIQHEKGSLQVTAAAQEHAQIAEFLAVKKLAKQGKPKAGEKRYSLKFKNEPVGAIVRTLSKELGVEVVADESLIEKLKMRTSLDVNQVTGEELLAKVLEPAGIAFILDEQTLRLTDK